MGLVVQVAAEDGGLVRVMPGQHRPVVDPLGLGVVGVVPELGLGGGVDPVTVEQDAHLVLRGRRDDGVHDLERGGVGQRRVEGGVDPGHGLRGEAVGRVGQPDGVEPHRGHGRDSRVDGHRVESVRCAGLGLEAEPVRCAQTTFSALRVEQSGAVGVQHAEHSYVGHRKHSGRRRPTRAHPEQRHRDEHCQCRTPEPAHRAVPDHGRKCSRFRRASAPGSSAPHRCG